MLSRREFLGAGTALYVTFTLGAGPVAAQTAPRLPNPLNAHPRVNAWLRINPDDTVTVFTGKVEYGQGMKTALVQLAAEELDVRPETVEVITADTQRTPNEAYTAGSRSIPDSGMSVRLAAAEARRILLELAAARLSASASSLQVRDARITAANGRSVRFGQLVSNATLNRPVDGTAPLKSRDQYRLVGQSLPRVDFPAKFFGGTPAFLHDLRLENMLHARSVHPPVQGARLLSVDTAAVKRMPGVELVLEDGNLLGVIAVREEQAIAAAQALAAAARWELPSSPDLSDDAALERYMRDQPVRHTVVKERGELSTAERTLRASYFRPFQAHASIGPSCSVAQFQNGQLTVWSHTQGIFPLRAELARALRMPETSIHAISLEGAGCYGQNGADDATLEAAMFARALPGRPVRLQWMRADEFGWEPLGAAMVIDCEARLDDERKRIAEWRTVVRGFPNTNRPNFGPGEGVNLLAAQLRKDSVPPRGATNVGLNRNAEPLYDIPGLRIEEELIEKSPLRVSSMRSLGAYANVFALESFIDELAHAAGADPVAFRLEHLTDERGRDVINAVAQASGWVDRGQLPAGRGLGLGYARYSNSSTYCAVMADVQVEPNGRVRVRKLWAAADCGPIVNPDGVRNQIGGGALQSASWTLFEAVPPRPDKAIAQWHEYQILRFPDAPEIEVILLDRPDAPIVGAGEASQGPAAAAIANAVFAASGARVRRLPLTPQRVAAAKRSTAT